MNTSLPTPPHNPLTDLSGNKHVYSNPGLVPFPKAKQSYKMDGLTLQVGFSSAFKLSQCSIMLFMNKFTSHL